MYGEVTNVDLSIELGDIDKESRLDHTVVVSIEGKDVEFWEGNHGAEFSKHKFGILTTPKSG